MRVCLINGSPSREKATSQALVGLIDARLGDGAIEKRQVLLPLQHRKPTPDETLDALIDADAWVLAFPLYAYGLPAALTRVLEELPRRVEERGASLRGVRVYAVVNSGHGEPWVNEDALRVVRLYCRRMGLRWRLGVAIGGGLVVTMMRDIPLVNGPLRRALRCVCDDVVSPAEGPLEELAIRPILPLPLMNYMKDSPLSKRFVERR